MAIVPADILDIGYTETGQVCEINSHVSQRTQRIREKQPGEHRAITLYCFVFSLYFSISLCAL